MKELLLGFLMLYNISGGNMTGKIIDKSTKEELTGVMVVLNEKDTTYTDFDGVFKFTDVDSVMSIDLEYIYITKSTSVNKKTPSKSV